MRTARLLALGLMLTLASAACATGGDNGTGVATAQSGPATATAAPSATATSDEEDAGLKFAQCMRQNGMSWFPDPDPDGRLNIRTPEGLNLKEFEKAQEACKQYAPNGGERPQMDAEALEKVRQMAKCMRENGVPDFPDPRPDGGMVIERGQLDSGPGDPTFDKAQEKCSQYLPQGPRGTGKKPA